MIGENIKLLCVGNESKCTLSPSCRRTFAFESFFLANGIFLLLTVPTFTGDPHFQGGTLPQLCRNAMPDQILAMSLRMMSWGYLDGCLG